MSKHTPGPWAFHPQAGYIVQSKADGSIPLNSKWILDSAGGFEPTNGDANARLVCAAPCMLEALKVAYETLNKVKECIPQTKHELLGETFAVIRVLKEEIAKATGES